MKLCKGCDRIQEDTSFSIDSHRKDGKNIRCRRCISKAYKAKTATCMECHGPRSYGSGKRCQKCFTQRSYERKSYLFFRWRFYYNKEAAMLLISDWLRWRDVQPRLLELSTVVAKESKRQSHWDGMGLAARPWEHGNFSRSHKDIPLVSLDAPRSAGGEDERTLGDFIAQKYR